MSSICRIGGSIPIHVVKGDVFVCSCPLDDYRLYLCTVVDGLRFVVPQADGLYIVARAKTMSLIEDANSSKVRLRLAYNKRGRGVARVQVSHAARVNVTRSRGYQVVVLVSNAVFVHVFLVDSVCIIEGHVYVQAWLCGSRQDADAKGYVPRAVNSSSQISGYACVQRFYHLLNRRYHGYQGRCRRKGCFFLRGLVFIVYY